MMNAPPAMETIALHPAVLVPFGVVVGFLGTLVGVGGGFFMVPYFTLAGGFAPARAVGTSLGAIIFNAVSGSVRWSLQRRIDWGVAAAFAVATLPGAWFGRMMGAVIDASHFKIAFAVVVALAAASMLISKPSAGDASRLAWFRRGSRRDFTDAFGVRHEYGVNLRFGVAVSLVVGFVSALFGVGGGFLHVPVMVVLYGMPMHVAVATSQVVLAVTAAGGMIAYALPPDPSVDWRTMLIAGLGAAAGAQVGSIVAPKIRPEGLKRILAALLFLVAVSMVVDGVRG
jgi:uncharacterized membrane protein YfcA